MRGFWTPEKVEILKEQWALGASVRVIAARLDGSRNAVIGKARRLELPPHEAAPRHGDAPRRAKKPKIKPHKGRRRLTRAGSTPQGAPLPPPPPPPPPAEARRINFAGLLPHHCRYPVTADAPFLFCGQIRQEKSAYCSLHHALCHEMSRYEEARRSKRSQSRSRLDFTPARARAA